MPSFRVMNWIDKIFIGIFVLIALVCTVPWVLLIISAIKANS